MYIGHRGDDLLDIVREHPAIDEIMSVSAGKFRRYHGEGWRQLLDIRSQLQNIRDVFRTLRGTWQGYRFLGQIKPDVIFTRGGFVSVPVALAGHLRRIPYVTHDSDSVPSLANRLIARWAARHIVAMSPELYPYPLAKTVQIGVPVAHEYEPVSAQILKTYRRELGLDGYEHVVLITGGGNGAQALNRVVVDNTRYLLGTYSDLVLLHFAGRALVEETNAAYDELQLGKARGRVKVYGFVSDFFRYAGAADVIVARGGATNLAEFAIQRKACVIVPSKQLVWNVHNSRVLAEQGAVVELNEDQADQPERLGRTIGDLLDRPKRRAELCSSLARIGYPHAAREIAAVLLSIGKDSGG